MCPDEAYNGLNLDVIVNGEETLFSLLSLLIPPYKTRDATDEEIVECGLLAVSLTSDDLGANEVSDSVHLILPDTSEIKV